MPQPAKILRNRKALRAAIAALESEMRACAGDNHEKLVRKFDDMDDDQKKIVERCMSAAIRAYEIETEKA